MFAFQNITQLLFGSEGLDKTFVFIFFTLIGMFFIKVMRYNRHKKQMKKIDPNTRLKFNLRLWLDDNLIDFVSAFMASFLFFRFFPDAFSFLNKFYELPVAEDKMFYGLILGMFFQYFLHRFMNTITIENTIEKI